jgi:hypothetical protein
MSAVTFKRVGDGIVNVASGSFTGDGTPVIINLGFDPSHFYLINETDVATFEKLDAQAAANTLKLIAAGTMTLDTSSAIVFNGDRTVTVSAATNIAAKAFKFVARRG